jgi:uncharacterized protein involved in exopolysaccharide biosynthesis
MIDATIINIIPPLVAAIFTYIIANRRARIQHSKLLADIQGQAIDQVSKSEEKMRKEIWDELDRVRKRNATLEEEKDDLSERVQHNSELIAALRQELSSMKVINQTLQTQLGEK